MKKLLILLLSALSLTALAQEKKTIVLEQPKCEKAMLANIASNTLRHAFLQSEDWQVVERISDEELNLRYLAGEPINVPTAQYALFTEITDVEGMCHISCRIMDMETMATISSAMEMSEASPQSIQRACKAIAKQLIEK